MVQAFGKDGFVFNAISENDYKASAVGDCGYIAGGKQKHGGVGGRGAKSHNAKEMKTANKRRNEKRQNEEKKEEQKQKAAWLA